VNLAVEPSFTLLGLHSTAKIHDAENNQSVIALSSGDNLSNQSFVNLDNTLPSATISGTVLIDTTNNGTGDTPKQGVEIELRDASGDLLQTTVTAVDGSYSFTVSPGDYQVTQVVPIGFAAIDDVDGGDLSIIGDQALIAVALNDTETGQDFTNSQFDVVSAPDFCLSLEGTLNSNFIRPEDLPSNVTYFLEYATTLSAPTTWGGPVELDSGNITTASNGNGTETVTITDIPSLTGLGSGSGFVRLRIEMDADGNSSADEVSTSLVNGWVDTTFGDSCRTYNNPFISCSLLSSTVTGVSGQVITLAEAVPTLPAGSHYIEITSGDNEGQRFDIASSTGNTLTVEVDSDLCGLAAPLNTQTNLSQLPASLDGDGISIHTHRTLNSTYPVDRMTANTDQALADKVILWNDGTFVEYYLHAGSPNRWVLVGDGNLDDQGVLPLPPGHGSFVISQTAKTITAYGRVREHDFARPICQGRNLIGSGYPLDQSAAGRDYTKGAGFVGNPGFKLADQFLIWNGDNTPGRNGYNLHYYLDFNINYLRWIVMGDASAASKDDEILFLRDRAVMFESRNGLETYIQPLPWAP
jgi:hypothetical protein